MLQVPATEAGQEEQGPAWHVDALAAGAIGLLL